MDQETFTYEQLLPLTFTKGEPPSDDDWFVQRHQGFDDDGCIAILRVGKLSGIPLRPGRALHVTRDEDGVIDAYSVTGSADLVPNTGAETYLAERLDDPDYAAAYAEAKANFVQLQDEFYGDGGGEVEVEASANTEAEPFPRHHAGPWFLLSDGTKVCGKNKAVEAEAELNQPPPVEVPDGVQE